MTLHGQVALVTGGGTGIGAEVARRFADEGAAVVVMGRRPAPLECVAAEIGGAAAPGDVASTEDVRAAVDLAVERFGGLDVVVNGAGSESADWGEALSIHVTGSYLVAREAIPRLLDRGGGSIVNIASVAALASSSGEPGYATSKAAVLGLTRSLAVRWGPHGIRVNTLCPGWVRTPMSEREMDALAAARSLTREEAFGLVSSDLPLRRVAEPEEIAAACLFLASRESSFITGAVLVVDGGSTAVDVGTLAFGRP